MESKFNFIVESELTENELANILGGGIISDLVVKGLTWLGDHIKPTEYPCEFC